MRAPRTIASLDVLQVVDALGAIVRATGHQSEPRRHRIILSQLTRLADDCQHPGDPLSAGDPLDRLVEWSHRFRDRVVKSRLAASLSHCARVLGRSTLADRQRVRALNQAELVEDPVKRVRALLSVVELLGPVDPHDSLREAILRAEDIVHGLPDSDGKRRLKLAVAHAVTAIGGLHDRPPRTSRPRQRMIKTTEGRFVDPTAGIQAPRPHRRRR